MPQGNLAPALRWLAASAVVDAAAQVVLFHDGFSATGAGCAGGVFRQAGYVFATFSEEVGFRASSALVV